MNKVLFIVWALTAPTIILCACSSEDEAPDENDSGSKEIAEDTGDDDVTDDDDNDVTDDDDDVTDDEIDDDDNNDDSVEDAGEEDTGGEIDDAGEDPKKCDEVVPLNKECCSTNGMVQPFKCIDGEWQCEYPYYPVDKGACGLDDAGEQDTGPQHECAEGEARCKNIFTREICVEEEEIRVWGDEMCPENTVCSEDECVPGCVDECEYGEQYEQDGIGATCSLYSAINGAYVALDADVYLSDRARAYESWINQFAFAAGGAASMQFMDSSLNEVAAWSNIKDSALWTGTYLAAEALRLRETGSPFVEERVIKLVNTMHKFLTVSDDPAYLARFSAPLGDEDARVNALFDASNQYHHDNGEIEGQPHFWVGDSNQGQYQGLMLGYALAYEALYDETTKELIRSDVVKIIKELMTTRPVTPTINGFTSPIPVDANYMILTDDEIFEINIDIKHLSEATMTGFIQFMPNLFGYVPMPDSAIMLASFFQLAILVTQKNDDYHDDWREFGEFYETNADAWINTMTQRTYDGGDCNDTYDSNNIVFMPMYNLARLEWHTQRREKIREQVLKETMWESIKNDKNAWFSYIYASNAPDGEDIAPIIETANEQLSQFPPPPRLDATVDNTADFTPNEKCAENSTQAIDVALRAPDAFIWQCHPYQLKSDGDELKAFPGIDFLAPYWLGRHHGFIENDRPGVCARWKVNE